MEQLKKVKLLPIALILLCAVIAVVALATPSIDLAVAADPTVEEEVRVEMPNELTTNYQSEFEISMYLDVKTTGKASRMTVNFNYPADKLTYKGYSYPDSNWQHNAGAAPSHNATAGTLNVVLTGFGGTPTEVGGRTFNFLTYKFELNSGLNPGEQIQFSFAKFSLPLSSPSSQPKVDNGSLVLPDMKIRLVEPAADAYLESLSLEVPGIQNAITLNYLDVTGGGKANAITSGNSHRASGTFTANYAANGNTNTGFSYRACDGASVSVSGCSYNASTKKFTFAAGANSGATASNVITITVTPESGNTAQNSVYTITINRKGGDTDNSIKNASNNGVSITKTDTLTHVGDRYATYNASSKTFTFSQADPIVYANRADWQLVATPTSAKATLQVYNETKNEVIAGGVLGYLVGGENTRYIKVTPEMGNAEWYTVKIYVEQPETSNKLSSLQVKYNNAVVPFVESFNPDVTEYTVKLPADAQKLDIIATAESAKATVTGANPDKDATRTDFIITCVPESGLVNTYTITVVHLDVDTELKNFTAIDDKNNPVTEIEKTGNNISVTVGFGVEMLNLSFALNAKSTADISVDGQSVSVTPIGNIYSLSVNSFKNGDVSDIEITVYAEAADLFDGYTSVCHIYVSREQGDSDAGLESVSLTKEGNDALSATKSGTTYMVEGTIEFSNKDGWTLVAARKNDLQTVVIEDSNGYEVRNTLNLTEGANEFTVTVKPQDGDPVAYKVIVNVSAASVDTTLKIDPTAYSEDEELHMTKISSEVYIVRYHVSKKEISVYAVANDSTAKISIIAVKEGSNVPLDNKYYNVSESITLTEEMHRLYVIVTAQSGDAMRYSIYLSPYGTNEAQNPENPEEPVEEPDYIRIDFDGLLGAIEGGDNTAEVGIKRDEAEKKFIVEKGTETATFSIKVEAGVTLEVLYGAMFEDEEAPAMAAAEVDYTDVVTPDGTVRKFKVNLVEGNNPIIFKVNETGIVGADEIYVLNIYRPVEAEKINKGGWIAGIVVLAVLFAAAVTLLVLLWLKSRKKDEKDPEDTDGEKEAAPEEKVEEAPVEETATEEAPNEETPVEETPNEEKPEEAPVEETPAEETAEPETAAMHVEAENAPCEAPVEEVKEEAPVEETPVEEPAVEPAPAEEATVEAPVEEAPVEEPAAEPVAEETVAAEEPANEEAPVEEASVAEEKEEAPAAEAQASEETEHGAENPENGTYVLFNEDDIHIKNVQTHKEKYNALSREQKTFYDELKLRAMAIPGATVSSNKSNEMIRIGQKRIMKLMIRREFVVACFFAENENVTELKRALRGKDVRINTKETEIPIYDVRGFDAACDMIKIVIDSMFKKQ